MPITKSLSTAISDGVGNYSFRNRIINGGFDVWQRGTSGFTTNASYTADRWWFVNDNVGASSVSRVDISSLGIGANYCLRAERTSGTNRWVVGTQLETLTLNQLKGQTVTLSVKIRKGSALTSDIIVAFGTSSTEAKFGSVVNDGAFTVLNSSLNTSTFTTFTGTLTIPAGTAALGIKVEFSASQAGASNAYFDVTDVQLEAGTAATPFERRPYGTELALCQRYYELLGPGGVGSSTTTLSSQNIAWSFKVPKRSTPTVTHLANYTLIVTGQATYTASATAIGQISTNGLTALVTIGSTPSGTGLAMCYYSNTENVAISSEL